MIASLTGTVGHAGLDSVVVETGGVGLLVHTTPGTAAECRHGARVTLATTLVVREDSLTLYGFAEPQERDLFETVQTVSGVGPRLALAMLSVLTPTQVRVAVGSGDLRTLQKVPGVGKKSAERLVLELRDRIGLQAAPADGGGGEPALEPVAEEAGPVWVTQVTEALVGLGWSSAQASDAVARVQKAEGGAGADADVSRMLRAALRELGR